MSDDLSWSEQTVSISRKFFITLRRLRTDEQALSVGARVRLVLALNIPYLNYCYILLIDNTAALDQMLQRALNSSVRFIFKLLKYDHISPHYSDSGWLDVKNNVFIFWAV